jgi:formate dehydrogenase iron-sulfur subunit
MQQAADARIAKLHGQGMSDAKLYDARDTSVGGTHAMFIIRGDERAYNLPVNPEVPTVHLRAGWTSAAIAAGAIAHGSFLAIAIGGRR